MSPRLRRYRRRLIDSVLSQIRLAPFRYLKCRHWGVAAQIWYVEGDSYEGGVWRGWVVLESLHRPLRGLCFRLLAPRFFLPLFYFRSPLYPGQRRRAPLFAWPNKRDTLYTSRFLSVHYDGAVLRLDLILRDHYVGRHRQVFRYILVLAGVVAVALRVLSLVRLILLRLLLHGAVRQLALY